MTELSTASRDQMPFTSIPQWAQAAITDTSEVSAMTIPEPLGTRYVLIGVGDGAAPVLAAWADALPSGVARTAALTESIEQARAALADELAVATVGDRFLFSGPMGACLRLRSDAVVAGLEDDEISIHAAGSGPIDVFCSHCRVQTAAVAAVDDVITCSGCGRGLLVYYHVSRRMGSFLGFMADAETLPDPGGMTQEESS